MKCEACRKDSENLVFRYAWRKNPMKVCCACAKGIDEAKEKINTVNIIIPIQENSRTYEKSSHEDQR